MSAFPQWARVVRLWAFKSTGFEYNILEMAILTTDYRISLSLSTITETRCLGLGLVKKKLWRKWPSIKKIQKKGGHKDWHNALEHIHFFTSFEVAKPNEMGHWLSYYKALKIGAFHSKAEEETKKEKKRNELPKICKKDLSLFLVQNCIGCWVNGVN